MAALRYDFGSQGGFLRISKECSKPFQKEGFI